MKSTEKLSKCPPAKSPARMSPKCKAPLNQHNRQASHMSLFTVPGATWSGRSIAYDPAQAFGRITNGFGRRPTLGDPWGDLTWACFSAGRATWFRRPIVAT